MIDRNRVPGQLSEEFSVLGSTGNLSSSKKKLGPEGLTLFKL